MFGDKIPPVYKEITAVIGEHPAYLVGGAVRDLLLGLEAHDLDFALAQGTYAVARKVADHYGGDFYILDPEREAARVILMDPEKQRWVVDFTRFRGKTIQDDLQARDFTITAMGLPVQRPDQLLDPCGGQKDLEEGVIRSCAKDALANDPLRALRAVRMAAQLRFEITPETVKQIRAVIPDFSLISPERMRDELFRIFEGPHQAAALRSMQGLGMVPEILPEIREIHPYQINMFRKLEKITGVLDLEYDQEMAANWDYRLLADRLGRFRKPFNAHQSEHLVPGRSRLQLMFLTGLYVERADASQAPRSGSAEQRSIADSLQLSNQEIDHLSHILGSVSDFRAMVKMGEIPLREIYRYFRRHGEAGISGVFLALAGFLADSGRPEGQEPWARQLDSARVLLESWWEFREERISPPRLLDGNDLQALFSLPPGPQIGDLLENIREAQVMGMISNREDARMYAEQMINAEGKINHDKGH